MRLPYLPQTQCHDFITPRASDDWESRFESLLELNLPIYWLTPVAGASDFRPGFLSFGYWLQLNALPVAPWHVHRKWTILVVFNLLRIMPRAISFHGRITDCCNCVLYAVWALTLSWRWPFCQKMGLVVTCHESSLSSKVSHSTVPQLSY